MGRLRSAAVGQAQVLMFLWRFPGAALLQTCLEGLGSKLQFPPGSQLCPACPALPGLQSGEESLSRPNCWDSSGLVRRKRQSAQGLLKCCCHPSLQSPLRLSPLLVWPVSHSTHPQPQFSSSRREGVNSFPVVSRVMSTLCLKGHRAVPALCHHQQQQPRLDELLSQPAGPFLWSTDRSDPQPVSQQFTLPLSTCSTLSYTLKFMQERCDIASINQQVIILFWKVTVCGTVLCVWEASSLESLVCLLFYEEQMLFICFLCSTPPRFKRGIFLAFSAWDKNLALQRWPCTARQ